jgi:hypothetical protein
LDDLTVELEEKARREINDKLADLMLLIEESLVATASSRTFSAAVGDEATTLKLSMNMNATALAIDREQFEDLAMEILKDQVPEGFTLRGEQIDFDFDYIGRSGSLYRFETFVKANLLPSFDTEVEAAKINGKYQDDAELILSKEIPGYVRAEFDITPKLPGRLGALPRKATNINIVVAA